MFSFLRRCVHLTTTTSTASSECPWMARKFCRYGSIVVEAVSRWIFLRWSSVSKKSFQSQHTCLECLWNRKIKTKVNYPYLSANRRARHHATRLLLCLLAHQRYCASEYFIQKNLMFEDKTYSYQGLDYLHSSFLQCHGNLTSSSCLVDDRWQVRSSGLLKFFLDVPHLSSMMDRRKIKRNGKINSLSY